MKLSESYEIVKKSIIAFIPKYLPHTPAFPPIMGTGFIIRENGLIVTNDHILKVISKMPKPPNAPPEEIPARVLFFKITERGLTTVPLEVMGLLGIKEYNPGPSYYGPKIPDIGFVQVKAMGLPALEIDASLFLEEGLEVATAGFPMGTDALMAPGWLHQITPILQKGIISAVLPFKTVKPHAFALNVMTQGGASGSPVFLPETAKVVGVLYASLFDINEITQDSNNTKYRVPTNISYAAPSYLIADLLKTIINVHDSLISKIKVENIDEIIKREIKQIDLKAKDK